MSAAFIQRRLMKLRHLWLLLALTAAVVAARAEEALYAIRLQSSENFEVLSDSGGRIVVFPVAGGLKQMAHRGTRPRLLAADYDLDVRIKTTAPGGALQEIMRAIMGQTGRKLLRVSSPFLTKAAPAAFLTAFDRDSAWFLALTPTKEADTYQLTCSFVIDDAPAAEAEPAAK